MKSKLVNRELAQKLLISLEVASSQANVLSNLEMRGGTPFEIHKSLNILYKELHAHEMFVRALLNGDSKKKLKETTVEIIKPQSWRFYTKESFKE